MWRPTHADGVRGNDDWSRLDPTAGHIGTQGFRSAVTRASTGRAGEDWQMGREWLTPIWPPEVAEFAA
jgi:hypothetical protein